MFTGDTLSHAQLLLVVLPSFLLFGYNQSGLGGLLSIESWVHTFPQIDTVHTTGSQKETNATTQGVIVATCTLGALFGSLSCSWIGDPLGRRRTVLIAAVLTFVGEVLECTAFGLPQFTVGRFVTGLGVGALSTTVPVWQSECSRAKNRGRHVVIDGLFICVGYVLQAWINLAFFQLPETSSLTWRLPLAFPALVSAVLIASIYLFPESPRWLASKHRTTHARAALSQLRALRLTDPEISSELSAIDLALEENSRSSAARKRDLFTMGPDKTLYRFSLCLLLQFLQQWCGSNLISSYSTTIFEKGLGMSSEMARILSGACLTWKFLSSFVAFFTIDRFGRRRLFMFSGVGMSSCMVALAITNSMPTENKSAQIASVFFVFFFNFFVPIGFLGCNYLYVTEIAPSRLRMPMTSFSTANHWLWNFAVLMVTPVAIDSIGYKYYILFAVLGGCIPLLVFFLFPETTGRSLEQMDDLFKEHDSIAAIVRASLKKPEMSETARLRVLAAEKDGSVEGHTKQPDTMVDANAEAKAEEKGPSKRALEKERKKAEAKAKAAAAKAANQSNAPASREPVDPFKQGWLRGVYNEKKTDHVHTRFPPEPNGYLHIGHAKSITVNFGFARSYGGKCNLRFDDTNPVKEEERYFRSIEEMVRWLGFDPYKITHSSDEFDKLYEFAEALVNKGKAYGYLVGRETWPAHRVCPSGRPVEENLAEFRAMRDGRYGAGEATLRLKQYLVVSEEEVAANPRIKTLADNPVMWDIPCYRVTKNNYHHRTGHKWKIYPLYDFAHPICDALEGITHSLCTVEFETARAVYNWVLEQLDLKVPESDEKGPMQREYGRLNVEGTILSKRKIAALVNGMGDDASAEDAADELEELKIAEEGSTEPEAPSVVAKSVTNGTKRKVPPCVSGWDDPRLFTLVALRRRGVPPGALKKFVLDLGVTKANANTMTHILDASIRTYLERTVPRLMLVLDPIKVTLTNLPDDYLEEREVPFDPKDKEKGTHKVPFTKTIYIERDDFRQIDDPDFFRLSPGQSVGLLHAEHPLRCLSFDRDETTGSVTHISAEYGSHVAPGKARIHWVAESPTHSSPIRAEARIYNSLFKSAKPGDELDWKNGGYIDDLNPESLVKYGNALIETGFHYIRNHAPWPKEEGEAKGTRDNSSVRFQGLRTAFFALDAEGEVGGKVVLNRIVSLKEDSGKRI
ncbi:putative class-I aminoacyl-tRNA synthetase family protein [Teratosphaeria destructans]|uniref:glutamine--tRNA ligase n=1 Tax=Teratosphaeria destructans TaxID=418781 RepID=A0A9W7SNY0_9PEZI|nr:putative class-I aminoacyl-tRNA synthetase family protein [Teratosphaeria destructans]